MEIMKLLILVLLLTSVFCLDGDDHRSENKCAESQIIEDILKRMARRQAPPKQTRLPEKKATGVRSRSTNKRQRFQTFVGLMGKRSFEDPCRRLQTSLITGNLPGNN
ncbi:uncharacterized protein [Nerophis lumbriciformis]|uniref:uncharacterized protein n=1 Tax=Nerophis lumbriciformis TaxID=546530 RepID=UPI003BAAD3AB